MNDLELDSLAEGLFKYIMENTEGPLDGIAVIGITLLKLMDNGLKKQTTSEVEKFAADFRLSLVQSWKARSAVGPSTKQ